jgi:hypothetical protein
MSAGKKIIVDANMMVNNLDLRMPLDKVFDE